MPFQKGESGNKQGRPKLNNEQKKESESFKRLLKESTVPALEGIIAIANDEKNRNRFNACKFIIEKAFGPNVAILDDDSNNEPLTIQVVRCDANGKIRDEDDTWD